MGSCHIREGNELPNSLLTLSSFCINKREEVEKVFVVLTMQMMWPIVTVKSAVRFPEVPFLS